LTVSVGRQLVFVESSLAIRRFQYVEPLPFSQILIPRLGVVPSIQPWTASSSGLAGFEAVVEPWTPSMNVMFAPAEGWFDQVIPASVHEAVGIPIQLRSTVGEE
jgi:hypothetical protein